MHKLTLATVAALLSLGASAMAETQNWNITEENSVGIKNAQGVWTVNVEGGKISGKAQLDATNGSAVTYKVEGTVKDGIYTVTMSDRSDGKKGCVWTGHAPAAGGQQSHGLIGEAPCEGSKLIIRAGF
ncbi:MAG TPA: hypothetical protein VIE47_00055 [Methylocystis sp.]|jgi:hypothetical protein